jgi:ADP-L-glycero-D-manno-heptose 6-epimerase
MTRIVVTGAAGFIGSNIVQGTQRRGIDNIIAVDDLTQGDKFRNLADLKIADYCRRRLSTTCFPPAASARSRRCSTKAPAATPWRHDGKYMMDNNYTLSCDLFHACQQRARGCSTPSSAATYGGSDTFRENPEFEQPLNVYGYSKLLFDQRMRRECGGDLDVATPGGGLSLLQRLWPARAAQGSHGQRGVPPVQPVQRRRQGQAVWRVRWLRAGPADRATLSTLTTWWRSTCGSFDNPGKSGIFNLGTGRAQPFNDVAAAVLGALSGQAGTAADFHARGQIEYIAFPDALRGKYQCYTQADLGALRAAGCDHAFADVQTGVARYMAWLAASTQGMA